jgi:chromosome segregation ATPase
MLTNIKQTLESRSETIESFWKIFGGAMMSIIVILLLTHIGNVASNFDKSFLALKSEIKDLSVVLGQHKELIINLEKNNQQCIERVVLLEKNLSDFQKILIDIKQVIVADTANITILKDNIQQLVVVDKDLSKQLQDVREKIIAIEASNRTAETIKAQVP